MPKTGNTFTDIFSVLSMIFPLLLAGIIFIKKIYRNESLNFLMILCLLNFVKNFLLTVPQLDHASQNTIATIFGLIEFLILIQLSKQGLPEKINSIANIFLIAFLSVIITFYLLEGINHRIYAFDILQTTIIIFVSILCLAQLIERNNLNILNEPLFWISMGSLFYFSVSILMDALSWYYAEMTKESIAEKEILMGIGNAVKYFFYLIAALSYQETSDEKENPSRF
jgi:hypothetical protein